MKKIKWAALLLVLISLVGWGAIVAVPAISQGIIGQAYYERLQKIGLDACAGNEIGFQKIRACLGNIGEEFSILGDTTEGNFRISIRKPYAEAFLEFSNWKTTSSGAGVRPTFLDIECFMHQNQMIPKFENREIELLKEYGPDWFKVNPESQSRYITRIVENGENVIVKSSPLGKLKDYVEYCPEQVSIKYLDDYGIIQNDETVLKKKGKKDAK